MTCRYSVLPALFILAAILAAPACAGATPLWTRPGTTGGDLSCVIIAPDDKTIIVGGDQLMSLDRDGRDRWMGSSGNHLAISPQGDYILASQGSNVRLLSSDGRLVWDKTLDSPVTDVSMSPDSSLIVASGGGTIRTMTFSGESLAQNSTMSINHVSVLPSARQLIVTTNTNVQTLDLALRTTWSDSNASQDLLAMAPDGRSFVTATNNRVQMFRGNWSVDWQKKFEGESIDALAYSRDGSTIVLGTDHDRVHVLNGNGTLLFSRNATDQITSVAVSGDGNTIVAGSLDKKAYVFNHAGVILGTFDTKTSIRANSVAVTSDGQLIVIVDASAAYGIPRYSFTGEAPATQTPALGVTTGATEETTPVPLPATTTRKPAVRTPTVPTPYPQESPTEESPVPPAIPVLALLFILVCRAARR